MTEDLNKGRDIFKEEAYELLAKLENCLLELEMVPDDKEMIERAFRAMHTIKGSSSMFGFDAIANLTHEAETVYEMVRKDKVKVTKELIDLTFRVIDQIMAVIGKHEYDESADESKINDIIFSFKQLLSKEGLEVSHPSSLRSRSPQERELSRSSHFAEQDLAEETKSTKRTYMIYFRPHHDIFLKGLNPLLLLSELCQLGRCTIITHTDLIPDLEDIDPEACYTYWDVFLTTAEDINAIRDIFIFVEDNCEIKINVIDTGNSLDNEEAHKHLSNIIFEKAELTEKDVEGLITGWRNTGKHNEVKNNSTGDSLQDKLQQGGGMVRGHQMEVSSIRVAANKLDKLVNLVGELVTVQARLSQAVITRNDPEMLLIAEEIERLTDDLRDSTMNVRLVPIGTIFNRFKRLVRDLSNELGKEVEFTTRGGETELDKNVIEKLNDPLVHIIRNSIDHGIEPPANREASGKSRRGMVHLSSEYSGANVLIKIRDDGAGIDLKEIRKDAIEKGLIREDTSLTERDILSIIFSPGFSTSEKVTKVSGRGVGLDVVKRCIDTLRGTVDIDSKKGRGMIITLKIPLTLAIIEGLLLKVGDNQYILPLSAVEECIELTRQDVAGAHGRHIVNVRGRIIPYIRLRDFLNIDGTMPDIEQIVITEVNGKKVGLAVDHVIGEHQTVIKSLGRIYRDVDVLSGATILGNGKVAIILNIPKIVEYTESKEMTMVSGSA
ncbi:MAG: chemotaxis protein CheA [Nitrospirae bacterium]|jgi:two-component system, chemotaxis family, sensor kinase CheA|nr:chemotaxis protein CheA [Nitrospirota bacterium]